MALTVETNYAELVAKARTISERRTKLVADREALARQKSELEASLVSKFGADYMNKFEKAKADIEAWEKANATVPA